MATTPTFDESTETKARVAQKTISIQCVVKGCSSVFELNETPSPKGVRYICAHQDAAHRGAAHRPPDHPYEIDSANLEPVADYNWLPKIEPAWQHFQANGCPIIEPQLVVTRVDGKLYLKLERVDAHGVRLDGAFNRVAFMTAIPRGRVEKNLRGWTYSQRRDWAYEEMMGTTRGRYKTVLHVGENYNGNDEGDGTDVNGAAMPLRPHHTHKSYGGSGEKPENDSNMTGWSPLVATPCSPEFNALRGPQAKFKDEGYMRDVLETVKRMLVQESDASAHEFSSLNELVVESPNAVERYIRRAYQHEPHKGCRGDACEYQRRTYLEFPMRESLPNYGCFARDLREASQSWRDSHIECEDPACNHEPGHCVKWEPDIRADASHPFDDSQIAPWRDELDNPVYREPAITPWFASIDKLAKHYQKSNKPWRGHTPWWRGCPEFEFDDGKIVPALPPEPSHTLPCPPWRDSSIGLLTPQLEKFLRRQVDEKSVWAQVKELCKSSGLIWREHWTELQFDWRAYRRADESLKHGSGWRKRFMKTKKCSRTYGESILRLPSHSNDWRDYETIIEVNPTLRTTGAGDLQEQERMRKNKQAAEQIRARGLRPGKYDPQIILDVLEDRMTQDEAAAKLNITPGALRTFLSESKQSPKKLDDSNELWRRLLKGREPGIYAVAKFPRQPARAYRIADADADDKAICDGFEEIVTKMLFERASKNRIPDVNGNAEHYRQQARERGFEPLDDIQLAGREVYFELAHGLTERPWRAWPGLAKAERAHGLVAYAVMNFLYQSGWF